MAFIRFVLTKLHPDSGVEDGLFGLAYALRNDSGIDSEDRRVLMENLERFERNLPRPDRFNRSASKGYYRRATRGIAWSRDSATECLSRMHPIKDILEAQGHQVTMLHETRVGYIVYEDPLQVAAEPVLGIAHTVTTEARSTQQGDLTN